VLTLGSSKGCSYHCSLILKGVSGDCRLKPFGFNNHWLKNRNFKSVVEEAWEVTHVTEWKGLVLK